MAITFDFLYTKHTNGMDVTAWLHCNADGQYESMLVKHSSRVSVLHKELFRNRLEQKGTDICMCVTDWELENKRTLSMVKDHRSV